MSLFDEWLREASQCLVRMSVPLLPGEEPPAVGPYEHPPPDGCRWETNGEFRRRILEDLERRS